MSEEPREKPGNFIRDIIAERQRAAGDSAARRHALSARAQRLPPHRSRQGDLASTSACAREFGGRCHLRFDDTNPTKEEPGVRRRRSCDDVRWLGFDWGEHLYYASRLLRAALRSGPMQLITRGQGVRRRPRRRSRSASTAARSTEPGREQPVPRPLGRGEPRPVPRGCARASSRTARASLRAKIDMASPQHQPARSGRCTGSATRRTTARATRGASIRCTTARTASRTRSRASRTRSARSSTRTTGRSTTGISTQLGIYHPQQIEFARLNLTHTVASKRKLLELVEEGHVARLGRPAHADARRASRRRGYTPEAIRDFSERDRRRQGATASSTSRCSSTACARTSIGARARAYGGAPARSSW